MRVGDASNLTLDPDLDRHYLMDTLQFRLPVVLDNAGRGADLAVLASSAPAGTRTDALIDLGLTNGILATTRATIAWAVATIVAETADADVRRRTSENFQRLDHAIATLTTTLTAAVKDRRPGEIPAGASDAVRAAATEFAAQAATSLDRLLEESHRAGLLVLGDRGMGGISSVIVGSVAVHAAAHSRCPVLVVRGAEPAAGPVVVGIDGSEAAELAVGFAFEECANRGAELVPVLAWIDSTPVGAREWYAPGHLAASIEQAARRTLSESLAGWRERYPDVVVRPELVHGHPREALVDYSKTAQLVVLGSRGRDAFQGLLLGSVSQTLLHHSACPVAVVPPTSSQDRPGERTRSASQPSENVDKFIDRPVNAVTGLLPDRQRVEETLDALRAAGTDISADPRPGLLPRDRGTHLTSDHGGRAMTSAAATPELRDRRAECAALDRTLGEVRSGRGQSLLIRGEAGVGKSALRPARRCGWPRTSGRTGRSTTSCGVRAAAGWRVRPASSPRWSCPSATPADTQPFG